MTALPAEPLAALESVGGLVRDGEVLVLTGAGISTDSGIPDYRGPTGSLRRHAPMTFQAFVGDAAARRRYWARSFLGWRQIADARPNAGHEAVTSLQRAGLLTGVITQNVDGLHQASGTADVVELHGGLDRTRCLDCGDIAARELLGERLRALNPGFSAITGAVNPDGDVELPDAAVSAFVPPDCTACGSALIKPDVVFFGESVPRERVAACLDAVERAAALLVLGSSLTVFSGFRFARAAARRGIPLAIVTQGSTRADGLATVKLELPLGTALPALAAACASEAA